MTMPAPDPGGAEAPTYTLAEAAVSYIDERGVWALGLVGLEPGPDGAPGRVLFCTDLEGVAGIVTALFQAAIDAGQPVADDLLAVLERSFDTLEGPANRAERRAAERKGGRRG